MRIVIILSIIFAMVLCMCAPASADLSIPHMPASTQNWNGYWQFEWDPNNPISAAMYCCWWEMVHGHLSKYSDALNGETSDGSSTPSGTPIETKSYCPACHVDDSFAKLEVDPDLQHLSDELMQTKPWLKEGKKTNAKLSANNTTTNKATMSFSDPVKI